MSKYKYIIHHHIKDGITNPALDEEGLTYDSRHDANLTYTACYRSDYEEMHRLRMQGKTPNYAFITGLETIEKKTDRFIDYKEREVKADDE